MLVQAKDLIGKQSLLNERQQEVETKQKVLFSNMKRRAAIRPDMLDVQKLIKDAEVLAESQENLTGKKKVKEANLSDMIRQYQQG
jgi:hypothetical protein